MDSWQPLVSVILPCYNVEKYIAKAVQSILEQTYENLEVVFVDDASLDGTRNILDTFTDKRIVRYYFEENRRKIGAVNEVIPLCKGELICFQDGDDWSEVDRIEKQVSAFKANPNLGICFTGFEIFDEEGVLKHKPQVMPATDLEIKNAFLNFGKSGSDIKGYITCATMMVRKPLLEKTKGYHSYFFGKPGEDIFLVYQIVKQHESVAITKALYKIVRSTGSFTDDQAKGINIKSVYIWNVISKLIAHDQAGVNLLDPENRELLLEQELISCEEALRATLEDVNNYKMSTSYKVGKIIVKQFSFLKKLK
ncbi:glycosyltransferase family 2 protein [Pontibacter sp. H259]|uniref:glycosyltransferase family 2 protein n=1 Tax=Pontibacter sp. H259 TaxID=3133421 RepID=UPI0030C30E40